jgi:CheY-like chemotaxis protein
MTKGAPIILLLAEDDPDDRMMIRDALMEDRVVNELHEVADGEELLAYLRREGRYETLRDQPLPGLILLDLNMPRMDGREALEVIKHDPKLRKIPVVVLTTSKAEEDIVRSYDSGANSFIAKPVTFSALVDLMRLIGKYWVQIVELPPAEPSED